MYHAASGAGLDAQRAAIASEAARHGWQVEWIEDAGFSARDLKRPGIQKALELLRSGAVEALLCAKLDRLSRSLLDFAAVTDRARRECWKLVVLDLGVDTSTPSGEMLANVLASFAQFERRLIGQRTAEALRAKQAGGVRLGRPPVVPDVVRERILQARAEGWTLAAIAAELSRDGVPCAHGAARWRVSTIARLCGSSRRRRTIPGCQAHADARITARATTRVPNRPACERMVPPS